MSLQLFSGIAAVVLSGLIAGLFYGYDCSVIRGFARLPDKEYIAAFQSINRAIQNPYFFLSFGGTLLVLPFAAWLNYTPAHPQPFYYLLAATVIYAVGVFGITAFGNVPLNNSLDQLTLADASSETLYKARQQFETTWNRLHHIRTYAAIIVFLLTILSLIRKS